jgi:hypothetical protein
MMYAAGGVTARHGSQAGGNVAAALVFCVGSNVIGVVCARARDGREFVCGRADSVAARVAKLTVPFWLKLFMPDLDGVNLDPTVHGSSGGRGGARWRRPLMRRHAAEHAAESFVDDRAAADCGVWGTGA